MGTIPTHTTHHITITHKHDTTHTTGSCHNKYDMAPQPSECTYRARTSRVAQARPNACLVVGDKEVSPSWIPWSNVHPSGVAKCLQSIVGTALVRRGRHNSPRRPMMYPLWSECFVRHLWPHSTPKVHLPHVRMADSIGVRYLV